MLIAEIRRKLPSIEDIDADGPEALEQIRGLLRETKEDLLTADVFGVVKYLPRRPYLETLLATIARGHPASGEFQNALPGIRKEIQSLTFHFWPNYATPFGLSDGRTEPDVELSGPRTLLLFEAKLGSAFGFQQLERELAVAAQESRGRAFFLVLVTPGSKPPRFRYGTHRLQATEYLAARAAASDLSSDVRELLTQHKDRVLWISWESIQRALLQGHAEHRASPTAEAESVARAADMLHDLGLLMRLRQIQPFNGFAPMGLTVASCRRRPVFLRATRNEVGYNLERPLRLSPPRASWRCPAKPAAHLGETFIPLGTCCESWSPKGSGSLLPGVPIRKSGFAIKRNKK